jgi:hypothetical protein
VRAGVAAPLTRAAGVAHHVQGKRTSVGHSPCTGNRDLLRAALAPLEPHVFGGEGAIYLWARLPEGRGCEDDRRVVMWLADQVGQGARREGRALAGWGRRATCAWFSPGAGAGRTATVRCQLGANSLRVIPIGTEAEVGRLVKVKVKVGEGLRSRPLSCERARVLTRPQAGVVVVPGSSCGIPGYVRCSYGNLSPDVFPTAVGRLRAGLEHLAAHGMTAMATA